MSSGNTSWFEAAGDPPSPEETQTLLVDVAATQIIRTDAPAKKPDPKKPVAPAKPETERPTADAERPNVDAEQPKLAAELPEADATQPKPAAARPKADAPRPKPEAAQPKNNPLRLKLDLARPKTDGGVDQTQVLLTSTPPESSETRIIRTDAPAKKPVFVDATGRRGKRVRRVAYGIALAVLIAVAAVWVSQFDSWAKPPAPATSGVTK